MPHSTMHRLEHASLLLLSLALAFGVAASSPAKAVYNRRLGARSRSDDRR